MEATAGVMRLQDVYKSVSGVYEQMSNIVD